VLAIKDSSEVEVRVCFGVGAIEEKSSGRTAIGRTTTLTNGNCAFIVRIEATTTAHALGGTIVKS
jgi:hypothetical protein